MPNSDSEWWRKCGMWKDNAEKSRQMTEACSQYPIGKEREYVGSLYDVPFWVPSHSSIILTTIPWNFNCSQFTSEAWKVQGVSHLLIITADEWQIQK